MNAGVARAARGPIVSQVDRRTGVLALLWAMIAVQVVWMLGWTPSSVRPGDKAGYDLMVVAVCVALAITAGRLAWLATIVRVALGLGLLLSVADRFGLLGGPGAAGVSWGTWSSFVEYTREVNAFLPAGVAPTLAMLATAAELAGGVALLLGVVIRRATLGVALLFTIYGIAMSLSLGAGSPFPYVVWPLAAASLALAWCDASVLSIDRLRSRRMSRAG
jgi:uncharacterized membrane protein YphA (DoxX/SURF4 family)